MNSELRVLFDRKKFKSDFLAEMKRVMARDKFFEKSSEFYALMSSDTLNCSFDIYIEILINYAAKAHLSAKKVAITQEFSTLLTQAFESNMQVDKKSKEIQDFEHIRNYCIQQFQNQVPHHQHTKKVGIFIEKILKVHGTLKQKKTTKILEIYQRMSFATQRQDVEFRIQCFQALIALMLQRLIIKLDVHKRQDYYLPDEYAFMAYMLGQHRELYFVLIKSLEQTIKIPNEEQVHIIKALQLFIVPFLTQDQFDFFQWWNADQAQLTIVMEFMNTFKMQAPVKFNEFTTKYPKLMPSHYHFNLLCCVLQSSQLSWPYLLNLKMQLDHDELLRQCFLLKFRLGCMKSLSRYMVRPSEQPTDVSVNVDRTLAFKTKDKFHILAKLCYLLYLRANNQEKEFFRGKDCSHFLEVIPYLGVFSLDLLAFNSVKVLDSVEIEHISYKFHLYDKRAYLNQSLFELIKNMIFQLHANPANKVLQKITTEMIKKTIYKFPTQTIIFAQNFPLVVKNFYNYVTRATKSDNVPQILFLLIFVSSMNKYTIAALVKCVLGTLNVKQQSSPHTTDQQEALFKEIGLQLTNLTLNNNTSPNIVVELNHSLLALFMSDKPFKSEHLPKKIRQVLEDGKLILDFRFEAFNYAKTYSKYARIALQYYLQDQGLTVAQFTNLQQQYEDLGAAMTQLTHRRSKFVEFFKQIYQQPEFLSYVNTIITWKDQQEYDTLVPLSRLYIMFLELGVKKTHKVDIKQFSLIYALLCETILPASFKLLKCVHAFKNTNLCQFTSILNQWINLNARTCLQRTPDDGATIPQNRILQNRLNLILFDELHHVKEVYHTVKRILIQP